MVSPSLQVHNQADLPPEIMDHIFEQLGPRNSELSYQNRIPKPCTKTLCSCLFVSRYYRAFALPRLFQSIRIYILDGSSLSALDLLLSILCPSESLHDQWISIIPFIRHFDLGVGCNYDTGFDLAEPYLLRLLSILSSDQTQWLNSLALTLRFTECYHFAKAFKDAVLDLLKAPRLQSVEIHGAGFLSPDFHRGTHIRQLDISSYDPHYYSHQPDKGTRRDSLLRSLFTDTSFPSRIETPETESLLGGLDHLGIRIRDDSDRLCRKVADILRLTATLKTLTLTCDGLHGYSFPLMEWDTSFGDMQALESLEILVCICCINDDVDGGDIISAGTGALYCLVTALHTIRLPMPRLAHLRWEYSFCMANPKEVSFLPLEGWLRSFRQWGTLDRTLTSDLFPVLSAVRLGFYTPHLILDDDSNNQNSGLGITARMARVREEIFSRCVAAFGDKFGLELED